MTQKEWKQFLRNTKELNDNVKYPKLRWSIIHVIKEFNKIHPQNKYDLKRFIKYYDKTTVETWYNNYFNNHH